MRGLPPVAIIPRRLGIEFMDGLSGTTEINAEESLARRRVSDLHRLAAVLVVAWGVVGLTGRAQPLRPPGSPTAQQAYTNLLTVRRFAFGGVGYAGATSAGETAYRYIAASTNAFALFSAALTNGNAEAKLYALCGIRQFAPGTFKACAESLRTANPRVETLKGCIVHHEFAADVIKRISAGDYDAYFDKARR